MRWTTERHEAAWDAARNSRDAEVLRVELVVALRGIERLLNLVRRLTSDGPVYWSESENDNICYFCGAIMDREGIIEDVHKPSCPWVEAQSLLDKEDADG